MKRKSHVALSAAALAAAVLVVGLGVFGGATPPPAQAIVAESPASAASPIGDTAAPALPRSSSGSVAERPAAADRLSATGMEHVPVFD